MVGIRERQKVARLIEDEFCSRRREVTKRPEEHEIVEQANAVAKELRLTADIKALEKAEAAVRAIRHRMHTAIVKKYPEPKSRHRGGDCHCTGDWWQALLEVAKEQIVKQRGGDVRADELYKLERQLLASLQTVSDEKALKEIIRKAGLA